MENETTPKSNLTHIREEDDARGKIVVLEIYTVRKNDREYRPVHIDKSQRSSSPLYSRSNDKKK